MKNDSVNGKFVQFHENGKVKFKGQFIMGYPDGKWLMDTNHWAIKNQPQNAKKGNLILEKNEKSNTINYSIYLFYIHVTKRLK